MNVQALPKLLSDAYALFDSLNLSVTALVAIGIVFTIVFLFAVREAATWFFKIDDIKKDMKQVRQLVVDMEAEVRMLQGLLTQNVKLAKDSTAAAAKANESSETTPNTGKTSIANSAAIAPKAAQKKEAEEKPQPRFTVSH